VESWKAVLLGAVQGATEFLPISSSGHLRLGEIALGLKEPALLFDIVLHVGTLLAVLGVLRAPAWRLIRAALRALPLLLRGQVRAAWDDLDFRWVVFICLATVPTGLVGVLLGDLLDTAIDSPQAVGGMLLLNGALLYSARFVPTALAGSRPLDLPRALVVGVVQGLAVTRGISRSGSTISVALWLGVPRDDAAQFSFLLSVPAILGALVLELDPQQLTAGSIGPLAYALGFVAAALVGVLCLRLLLNLVRRGGFHHFAWYCWALGLAALIWGIA